MKRDWLTLAFGIVLVGAVVGLSLRHNMTGRSTGRERPPSPSPAPAATASAPSPPSVPLGPAAVHPPDGTPVAPRLKNRVSTPAPVPEAGAPEPSSAVALQVQSDVHGASVFLDREFVGTTPLTIRGLTTGPKQLNVTATGHDGYSATLDLTEGQNRVSVEFMKVRLNASVPVVHRHAMGSCQGTLAASPKGLTYDTPNKTDAFAMGFADVDEFEVDYLKKNLKVRRRAGKTWNFTNANADALLVFHRDVTKVKDKLAAAR